MKISMFCNNATDEAVIAALSPVTHCLWWLLALLYWILELLFFQAPLGRMAAPLDPQTTARMEVSTCATDLWIRKWWKQARVFEIPARTLPVLLSLSCSLCFAHMPSMVQTSSTPRKESASCVGKNFLEIALFFASFLFNMAHIHFQRGYEISPRKKSDWHWFWSCVH